MSPRPSLLNKVVELPATTFRHQLTQVIERVEKEETCVVVTVLRQPRVVVTDFATYQQLCFEAGRY